MFPIKSVIGGNASVMVRSALAPRMAACVSNRTSKAKLRASDAAVSDWAGRGPVMVRADVDLDVPGQDANEVVDDADAHVLERIHGSHPHGDQRDDHAELLKAPACVRSLCEKGAL
jgi:hypothetical protein